MCLLVYRVFQNRSLINSILSWQGVAVIIVLISSCVITIIVYLFILIMYSIVVS